MDHRTAELTDIPMLTDLMELAIGELQKAHLDAAQIAASRLIMGLDSQLVADGTYYVVEVDGQVAGCGGWSRRATAYGGDHTPGRDESLLDPARDAARIRAMYTHPSFARRGVGRYVINLCEAAATEAGFGRCELVATLAGEPLYRAVGYREIDRFFDSRGGVPVPLIRMARDL